MSAVSVFVGAARAQLSVTDHYVSPSGPLPIQVEAAGVPASLRLTRFSGGAVLREVRVEGREADALALFPELRSMEDRALAIQLIVAGKPTASPLVIESLGCSGEARDGWTARVLRAMESGDRAAIDSLLRLTPRAREALRREVIGDEPAREAATMCRVYTDQWIEFETEHGVVTIALRPEAAPRSAWWFRSLVEDGYYDGMTIACARESVSGEAAFLQGGEKEQAAACGAAGTIPFEASTLEAGVGVVALARRLGEPDSASSRFVIVLKQGIENEVRDSCVTIGVVIEGAETIRALSARGAEPATIVRASLIPAAPIGTPREPIRLLPPEDGKPDR